MTHTFTARPDIGTGPANERLGSTAAIMLDLHEAAERRRGVTVMEVLEENLGAGRIVLLRAIAVSEDAYRSSCCARMPAARWFRTCSGASIRRVRLTIERRAGSVSRRDVLRPWSMLLFQKRFHEGLVSGAVKLTFRRWARPHVRVGGRYRCHPIGVLEVDDVRELRVADITEADARASGFRTRAELIAYMKTASEEPLLPSSRVWRVALHHGGDGDRVGLALEDQLTAEDVQQITARLGRLDAERAWTTETLNIIRERPRVAASQLARTLGRDTLPFKVDVRKLKKLGLTQSFEVGYEISPRGRAYLAALAAQQPSPAKRPSKKRTPAKKTGRATSARKA